MPLLVAYFTEAAPLEPPVRLTVSVTLPADCAMLTVDADSATVPGAAAAPLPLIVTTALAGKPTFAPVALESTTLNVFEPVKGVELKVDANGVTVKGAKGTLSIHALPGASVVVDNGVATIQVAEGADDKFGGTLRALVANMVKGVSDGYERKLELVGVGYRASMAGKSLNIALGFSHPVVFEAPEGISIETPTQTEILIKGSDKQRVGEVAAKIRSFRPPEPYKGKGVRYSGEKITLKEAKKA